MWKRLIVGVVSVVAAVVPAHAAARLSCSSGTTVFKRPAVRVFRVRSLYRENAREGFHYNEFYLCARGSHRPYAFWGEPFLMNESVSQYKLVGDRLGFLAYAEGIAGGAGTTIGWVHLPRGPVEYTDIFDREEMPEEVDPGPKVPSEEVNYAIAEDGTVAVAGEARDYAAQAEHPSQPAPHEWEVCILLVKRHGLAGPKALLKTTSPSEAPVLSSIAINASTVSWRNREGVAVSVPR